MKRIEEKSRRDGDFREGKEEGRMKEEGGGKGGKMREEIDKKCLRRRINGGHVEERRR